MFKQIVLISFISTLFCTSRTKHFHIADTKINYNQIEPSTPESDQDIDEFISPYRETMNEEMTLVIGQMPEDLVKSKPNSNMGNWFTDAMLDQANKTNAYQIDFAVQNYGGLRLPSVPAGPLTKGKIYELMPFDNMLVVLKLDSDRCQKLLNKIASSGGWPVSKNLSFRIEDGVAKDVKIHGELLDSNKTYRVALPDYIANGGDNCDFLIDVPQDNSGAFIREIIIEYLEDLSSSGQIIEIDNTKRIF